jgi:hypothetical protein
MGKGGSVPVKEGKAMSENALVNAGAVAWPHDSACFTIRSMQTKLHRWAGENPSRRFGDNGVVFTGASSVKVTCYRYRGSRIPTPWTPKPAAAAKRQLTSG